MTNPLFAIYRASVGQPKLEHETLTTAQRGEWFKWIARARQAFRSAHPDYVEVNGAVKPQHHEVFVQFCELKYPARRVA